MSQADDASEDELLTLIRADPEEAFQTHAERYRRLRDESDSELVRRLITHGLEKYVDGGDA